MILPFLKSLIIHALIFSVPLWTIPGCNGGGKKQAGNPNEKVEIRPKDSPEEQTAPDEIEVALVTIPKKKVETEVKECVDDKWYGGIGIVETYTPEGEIAVAEAVAGYPAARAGIEKGDVILTNTSRIRGEPGTIVEVGIRKLSGEIIIYTITRAKICTY